MQNRGITMITLVITIIILIIIAGVTIGLLTDNDGLINKTKIEKSNFDTSVIRSNVKLAIVNATENGKITEQSLTNALDNKIGNGNYSLESKTNGWIIRTGNEEIEVTNNGKILAGEENNNEQSSEQSENPVITNDNLASRAKVGDYVAYNPTVADAQGNVPVDASKLTYTSNANLNSANTSGNGYGAQTFTANSNIKWKILSKNETTGQVVLTSEYVILSDNNALFYLKGPKGYLYAEQELNEICKIYGYGYGAKTDMVTTYEYGDTIADVDENGNLPTGTIVSGARCINAEDLKQIFEISPSTSLGNLYGTQPYSYNTYYPTIASPTGESSEKQVRSDTYTYYLYNIENHLKNNGIKSYAKFNVLYEDYYNNGSTISFLLATRGAECYDRKVYFCVFKSIKNIQGTPIFDSTQIGDIDASRYGYASGYIRPLVYLSTNIETSGKNADGAWVLK